MDTKHDDTAKRRRAERGLTLIELAAVIAITAIGAAVALPDLSALIAMRRLQGASGNQAADLQFARTEAIARNRSVRLSVRAHGDASRFSAASPPLPSLADERPLATTVALALDRGAADAAPPTCFSGARKAVRYTDGAGLRIADVAVDVTAGSQKVARWDETDDRFLAWHCVVVPQAGGKWSGRATLADGWSIGTAAAARRVCRYVGGGPIDANIAHPADWRDDDGPLAGQDFLVVRGSEACPPDRTAQHQP